MKKVHLLSTVTAALLLTAGAVSAQGLDMKKDEAPAHAPAAQRKAPAEKMAPSMKAGEHRTPATPGQGAQNLKPGEKKLPETTGQAPNSSEHDRAMKSESMDKKDESTHKDDRAQGAHDTKGASSNESMSEQHRATTGQGAAAGAAKLSTEQRSKITTIFKHHRVAPAHLNISIHVGARVPETVHFYPLPVEVVDVYPEWRGYDYILVGDHILVVDPDSHEIVAVLEA